jgi:hypothetical protein
MSVWGCSDSLLGVGGMLVIFAGHCVVLTREHRGLFREEDALNSLRKADASRNVSNSLADTLKVLA